MSHEQPPIVLSIRQRPELVLEVQPRPQALVAELVPMLSGPPGPGVPAGGQDGELLRKRGADPFQTAWVAPPRLVTTRPLPIQDGRIELPSEPLGDPFMDMALVFTDMTPEDLLPDGQLVNRPYPVEEHIGLVVQGSTAVFQPGAELDGKFAKVSYLAWPS